MSYSPAHTYDVSIVTRLRLNAWAGIHPALIVGSVDWLVFGGLALLHFFTGLLFVFSTTSGQAAGFHSLPLDEAWTRMVYARNFAEHFAFQYNPGTAEAGFTSPLWIILLGGVYKVTAFTGVTLPAIAKLLGIGFAAGASMVAYKLVQHITGSWGLGVVAAGIIALEPAFSFAKVSGTESSLFAFAALAAAAAYYRNRLTWAGILLALAVAARPEGLLLVVAAVVALGLKILWERGDLRMVPKEDLVLGVKLAGPPALVVVAVAALNMAINGTPYPNSYLAQHAPAGLSDLTNLWNLLQGYFSHTSFFSPIGVAASVIVLTLASVRYVRHRRFNAIPLLVFPLILTFALSANLTFDSRAWDITDRRYLDPIVPFLVVGLAAGIFYAHRLLGSLGMGLRKSVPAPMVGQKSSSLISLRPGSTSAKWLSLALTSTFVLLAVLPYAQIGGNLISLTGEYSWNSRNVNEVNVAAAHWINQNLPPDAVIGTLEGGAVRFFGDRQVVDLSGTNTHTAIGQPVFSAAEEHKVDYLVAFRNVYFDSWPLEEEVFSFSTERNTILEGSELVIYRINWELQINLADKTVPQTLDVSDLILIDHLDVGDQAQEEAHFYSLSQPGALVERVFHIAREQGVGIDINPHFPYG